MNVFPIEGHTSTVDRDPAVLFFFVVVGGRRPAVDFTGAVFGAGQEQHLFGDGRLAGVDVCDDADVANVL